MNLFKNFLQLSILLCILSCSDNDNINNPMINSLSSTHTFIGDTLVLSGSNLKEIGRVTMFNPNTDRRYGAVGKIVSKTDSEIKFIVPELVHEKATITFNAKFNNIDPIDVDLYGYLPFESVNNSTIYRYASVSQVLNDNIVYCYHDDWNKRFKLTNNYSDLEELPLSNYNGYEVYYYTAENTGYILTSDYSNYNVYSFQEDINNRNLEYNISKTVINRNTTQADPNSIKYISEDLLYIMNNQGEVFRVLDGNITPFIDLYPELINTPYMTNEYTNSTTNLQVLDDGSFIITSFEQNCIIKIKNTKVDLITFSGNFKPTFFRNQGGFYLKAEHKIYRSNDYGQTWTASNINFPKEEYIDIDYLGGNQFILHRYRFIPTDIGLKSKYISTDNGNSWKIIFYSRKNYGNKIKSFDEYGMTFSDTYGLVKFRRFPEDF